MRHRWTFYDPEAPVGASPAEQPASPQPEAPREHMIPKQRFDEVNNQLKDLMAKEQQRAAEQKQAEEAEAKRRGEWESLATQREQELATLKPLAERASAYEKMLNQHVNDQIKDWPDTLKALDPGKDNLEARLEWVKNASKIAAELKKQQRPVATEAGAHHNSNSTNDNSQQPTAYSFQKSGDVRW